ncbi:MAG: EAL domain-containing protein [Algicola sp.]|nr:EAL domain-containing protein [Algicola sp.]
MNKQNQRGTSNVFIVDDNPANTMMLQQVVKAECFDSVNVFHDPVLALAEFHRLKPNLVLLDLVMPKLNGIEFLRKIEQQIKNAEVSVVVLTANHNEEMRIEALSLGAQDYIEKPFDIAETLQRIRNVEVMQQHSSNFEKLSEDLRHKLKKTREDLSDVLLTLNAVFKHSSDYVFVTDGKCNIIECNKAGQERFGIIADQEYNLFNHFAIDNWVALEDNPEFVYIDEYHRRVYLETSYSIVEINDEQHYIFIFKDITLHKEDEINLRFLTETDYITHLPNRHQLQKMVDAKCECLDDQQRLSFIFLSFFDNAKEVELHGHERLESLMLNIALILVELSETHGSVVIHWGDNDFLMVEESTNAQQLVTQVQHRFNQSLQINEYSELGFYSRPTLGIFYSDEIASIKGKCYDKPVHNALLAAYEGARFDRKLTVFDRQLHDKINYQALIEKELFRAIEQNSFKVAYQPKVDLQSHKVVGVEALVRWHHEELGMIRPDIFVPIAENAGLINEIGAMVLSKVVNDIVQLREKHPDLQHVAVNVAAPQLDNRFIAQLQKISDESCGLCQFIELEITETSFLDDFERVNPILKQIKAMGFRLAIDDFGTGYSSLSYLHELPIDTLKIDRSFIIPILESEKSLLMVKSIISMSLSLGLEIVAEGIEDGETGQLLHQLGVHQGQGYFYHKPAFL